MARWTVFGALSRSNVIAAWGERLWKWLGPVVASPVVATVLWGAITAGLTIVQQIWAAIPLWYAAISSVFTAILVAHLFITVKRAFAIRGLQKLDIRELGKSCVVFQSDVMEFLVNRVDASPGHLAGAISGTSHDFTAAHAEWARYTNYANQTQARAVQRFAHRALALRQSLTSAGIKPPSLWAFEFNIANVAIYIGAVGDLLERGLLREARLLEPDEQSRLTVHLR